MAHAGGPFIGLPAKGLPRTAMGDLTAEAKRFFETLFEIDASRGETLETSLGADGVLYVRATFAPPEYPIQVRFAAE